MDLEHVRREYTKAALDLNDLSDDPVEQFNTWLQQTLALDLSSDPTAMTLATLSDQGQPYTRTVLLKSFDSTGFVFYTNYGSRKAQHIENNPNVSLLFHWVALERQIMINGVAQKLSIKQSADYFRKRPRESQLAAWASKQSRLVSSRQFLEQAFQEMKRKFAQGEVPVPTFWGGYKVEAHQFEFWQGRSSRLHDRFIYTKTAQGTWEKQRWQP